MRLQPFGLGQRDRGGADGGEAGRGRLDPGGALQEVEDREAGGEAGGAAGRQHVVRPGDIVAHRLRAEAAEEGRAGMADLAERPRRGSGSMICRCSGASRLVSATASVPVAHQDDRAVPPPALAGDGAAREGGAARPRPRRRPASAKPASSVIRIACAALVVLGLGQQVDRDMARVVRGIGQDHHLGGAGDAVDADPAEDLALGLGDIGIAGADDAVDRGDAWRCPRPAPPRPGRRRCGRSRSPRRGARRRGPAG